ELQHFSGAPSLEKLLENQSDPVLHFLAGIVTHEAGLVAYQTNRQRQSQVAPLRLVQQTGCQTRPNGEQFDLREFAFQPPADWTIGSSRIIDAVVVGKEAVSIAAEI